MLKAVLTLFACLTVGNGVNRLTGLPLPGPVLGLLLMLALLWWRGGPDEALRQAGNGLLRNMSVLFVPAGVGLITQLPVLQRDAAPIGIAIIISTTLGMAATAFAMHRFARGGHE